MNIKYRYLTCLLLFGNISHLTKAFVVRPSQLSTLLGQAQQQQQQQQQHPLVPVSTPTIITTTTRSSQSALLFAKARKYDNTDDGDGDDNTSYFEALAHNKARTDVRNFLTQRAIQSFIFLLITCRDDPTVKWLEKQFDLQNLEHYHGTGALNVTKYSKWDSILQEMLQKPKDVVIVTARPRGRRGKGVHGWSNNNPHVEVSFVEFEIDIDPVSLVSRIMSVREQIAREWVNDLDSMVVTNEMILQSYHDMNMQSRDEEECLGWRDDEDNEGDDDADDDNDDSCVNVEHLRAPYSDPATSGSGGYNSNDPHHRRPAVFDRNAMMMLNNAICFDERESSPYRKGNFDLLCLLATQEAVHRVLREYRQDPNRDISREWLRDFYASRVTSMFDGNQEYGRAEDFLEELLTAPPTMKELQGGKQPQNEVGLIDPLRIAEDVIRMRSIVAADWKDIVANVPSEHMSLRKDLLTKQMGDSLNPSPFASSSISSSDVGAGSIHGGVDLGDNEDSFQ